MLENHPHGRAWTFSVYHGAILVAENSFSCSIGKIFNLQGVF